MQSCTVNGTHCKLRIRILLIECDEPVHVCGNITAELIDIPVDESRLEARNAGTIEQIIKSSTPNDLPQDFSDAIIENYNARLALIDQGYAVNDAIFGVVLESTPHCMVKSTSS